MNLQKHLQELFRPVLAGLGVDPSSYVSMIKPVQDPRYGDYQANFAMPLAKEIKKNPTVIAQTIVAGVKSAYKASGGPPASGETGQPLMLDPPEIAGPGFINLRFNREWLAQRVQQMAADARLGVPLADPSKALVIDFSSPNVAKPMHVGHLRSTIIGDALARLFGFLGHRVVTDNHLGDWGTQFGMLLYGYKNFRDEEGLRTDPVREMVRLYLHVRKLMDEKDDAEDAPANPVADAVRQETAKLHAGDPENLLLWKTFMPWCLAEINKIYNRLDIHFDHTHGESFYNPMLPEVVESLQKKGLAQDSQGAVVVFFAENEPPALVRKKDGAFTYTTTDLATIKYRVETYDPTTVLYVVDFRQGLHFKNLFNIARRWGYDKVELEHISFGSVLGTDNKPIKTREGGGVELNHLLDEAVQRAATVCKALQGGDTELTDKQIQDIAEVVGIGAVKYADLSQNRTSDYVFSWDKMLAMDGNTATYMQYAYTRIRGIFRKADILEHLYRNAPPLPKLQQPQEAGLALQLLRFEETLTAAAADYRPSVLTAYLWDLAKCYSGFYQNCPVLKAETPEIKQSRLLLCDLTGRVISKCLSLLGIRTLEQM
ncbi:MAG: arginine--tRNA ligase [Gemmataceae bacterium]